MDHIEALPDDALAAIIGRLGPRDLAASRCVRKAWRAVVDARRLLLPHLLLHSVEGIFANYNDHHRPQFLARPSTSCVNHGNLHFLPNYTEGYRKVADHCNGILLYGDTREFFVVNPATRRWERLPGTHNDEECREAYLAFDPAASPHYEVFLIPPKDLGLFDVTDCELAEVQPEQLVEENFTISSRPQWSTEVPQHSTEWPPAVFTLDVFSSSIRQWQERSFVREGSATRRVVNLRGSLMFLTNWVRRWRYSAYWGGALHVLLCRGTFVTRLSLSTGKYQVIKTPIDANEHKVGQHYLGSSEAGVYFANLRDRIRIWYLIESNGEVQWVLKNSIGLVEPPANISSLNLKGICRPWIFDDDPNLDKYCNNKRLEKVIRDWNWDDDNILDECGRRSGHCPLLGCELLGFHPYKEIAFFLMERFEAVAYHFDSSKVQYIGYMRPTIDSMTLSVDESFLYTPCMIGDLPEKAERVKHRHKHS
ncbi:unnamed protein product [Triticum turgidum subsp. durum]|uniref:F-box domain-containing protein n=1 Tax=Triticum turgidum subsp. durum TaxID=4567 RepID=A0A9R1QX15_TRITD|nr:unnamed protein product [Triticum turgidum subsp. durum]